MSFDKTFDLFAFLGLLNKRNLDAYNELSLDAKKAAHPLVVMRWLSGTSDEAQIIRLNTFANKYVFSLGNEKQLLFKLLAASCTGKTNRSTWLKGPSSPSTRLALDAIKIKYECSTREAVQYLKLLDAVEVIQFAEEAGWEKEALKKLTIELAKDNDTGSGIVKKSSSKPKK